jgi:Xaa-Pro aminopeptidase
MKRRHISSLQEQLEKDELEGLLITQHENRYYLTGFSGSAGAVLLTASDALLVVDFRYWEQAAHEAPGMTIIRQEGRFDDLLPSLLSDLDIKRLGFEAETVTIAQRDRWQGKLGDSAELVPTTNVVERMRATKEEGEIALIRQAVALTDRAFAHMLKTIHPGMTEWEIAWELEVYLRTHGSDGLAFETIVASGPNAALPHAKPTDRPVQAAEPILFDFGARVGHYCADFSRTICLGDPPRKLREVHDIVLRAQQAALAGIRSGMTAREADALARDIISAAGYRDQFGHGLGHGVGLVVHEAPKLSWQSDDELKFGMVVTVEPGIYIPDWGGVRIEDIAVVREDGAETLTAATKQLCAASS